MTNVIYRRCSCWWCFLLLFLLFLLFVSGHWWATTLDEDIYRQDIKKRKSNQERKRGKINKKQQTCKFASISTLNPSENEFFGILSISLVRFRDFFILKIIYLKLFLNKIFCTNGQYRSFDIKFKLSINICPKNCH